MLITIRNYVFIFLIFSILFYALCNIIVYIRNLIIKKKLKDNIEKLNDSIKKLNEEVDDDVI